MKKTNSPTALRAREGAATCEVMRKAPIRVMCCAEDVMHLLWKEAQGLEQECFWVIAIDVRNNILGYEMIAKGTVHSVEVSPRDVFRYAVRVNAAGIVLCHNHPTDDTTPSQDDIDITRRHRECGTLLGIPVVDHVILGTRENSYKSMADGGYIKE